MSNFLPHPLLTLTFQNTENSSRTHLIDVIFKTQGLERVRSVYEECFLIPRGLKTMHKSSTWGEKWVFLEILWCNVPGEQQICVSECRVCTVKWKWEKGLIFWSSIQGNLEMWFQAQLHSKLVLITMFRCFSTEFTLCTDTTTEMWMSMQSCCYGVLLSIVLQEESNWRNRKH